MIALGNDVIDRSWQPNNGTKYFNRLRKYAFLHKEEAWFEYFDCTHTCVFWLWSVKEAAYKTSLKLGNHNAFRPKDYQVTVREDTVEVGEVLWGEILLSFNSTFHKNFIHTITYAQDINGIIEDVEKCGKGYLEQFAQARRQLVSHLPPTSAVRKDSMGVPHIYCDKEKLNKEVSISHHEHFVATVLTL